MILRSILLAAALCHVAAAQTDRLDAEQKRWLRLLDRLSPFDPADKPFGRVMGTSYRYGFLLRSTGREFVVRHVDQSRGTYRISPNHIRKVYRVRFEPMDLAKHALEFAPRITTDLDPDYQIGRGHAAVDGLELWRACVRTGHRRAAAALWARLAAFDDLRAVVGDAARHALTLRFLDLSVSRAELVGEHVYWLDAFPRHPKRAVVRRRMQTLQRMLKASRNRPEPRDEPARLVWQLRDDGPPASVLSYLDHVRPGTHRKRPARDVAAQALSAMGMRAVPALIEALDDDALSRSVASTYTNARIRTVAELAHDALQRILRREAKDAKAWRRHYDQLRAEHGPLTAAVRACDRGSARAAKHLLRLWPEDCGVVLAAAKKAPDLDLRLILMRLAAKLQHPEIDAFLVASLARAEGHPMPFRLAAAELLLARGRPEWRETFLTEWRSTREAALLSFLLRSRDEAALRAVSEHARTSAERTAIIDFLWEDSRERLLSRVHASRRDAYLATAESVLGACLADRTSGTMTWIVEHRGERIEMQDPSVADSAATLLARYWPRVYGFDPTREKAARDAAIAELEDVWRKRVSK